jgi:hypothetical protein
MARISHARQMRADGVTVPESGRVAAHAVAQTAPRRESTASAVRNSTQRSSQSDQFSM